MYFALMVDENITSVLAKRASEVVRHNRRRALAFKKMTEDRPAMLRWLLSLKRMRLILAGVVLAGIFLVPPITAFTADLVHSPKARGMFKKKMVRTVKSRSLAGSLTAYYWLLAMGTVVVMTWRRIPEHEDDATISLMVDPPTDAGSAKTMLSDATADTIISQDRISQDQDVEQARASVVLPAKERYRLEEEIGRGGMGIVFRGTDTLLSRPVALKSLTMARSGDTTAVERFVREAQALAKLTHPSIVQVYDLAELDGELFMAMELVEGKDLAEYLTRQGALGIKEALSLATDMAQALAYAHGRGVIHRDFKPGNVILSKDGVPKVMDFGLAKIAQAPSMTMQGAVMGSPNYMSPEQASGSQTDKRTDVYAFGITLFEMIAGEPPFIGDTMEVMMKQISERHPDLRQKTEGVPDALVDLIDLMLAKKPEDRISDMGEVVHTLSEITKSI